MNYPAASSGVLKTKTFERPKERGIKPLPASGGINCKDEWQTMQIGISLIEM